jgi:hypothetical protein
MNRITHSIVLVGFSIWFVVAITSCNNDNSNSGNTTNIEDSIDTQVSNDSSANQLIVFNGVVFSIPSPYETAITIKKKNIDFNSDLLNPIENDERYTDNFKKALNLGVYGADLAYLNIYEQGPSAIKYFTKVKLMAQSLDIASVFDKELMQRIEKNMGNKDSLMHIISGSYRKADEFLKNNQRPEISALVLTGGFVESLYMMVSIVKDNPDKELLYRLGEQKNPLENLIKVLSPYYGQSDSYAKLIDAFVDLAYEFDGIDVQYHYEKTDIFPDKKLTVVNSTTDVVISDEQMKEIVRLTNVIRNFVIE